MPLNQTRGMGSRQRSRVPVMTLTTAMLQKKRKITGTRKDKIGLFLPLQVSACVSAHAWVPSSVARL